MGLSEQLTIDERARWEAFFQCLGASLRASSMLKVLDNRNPIMTPAALSCAALILTNELTIVELNGRRGLS